MITFNGSRLKTLAMRLALCGIAAVTGCEGRSDKMANQMKERPGAVTMKGKPLTLLGNEPKVGDIAPDIELIANDMSHVKLSSYRGKVCIISAVPSLDTSVCSTETRRFNEEAAKLGSDMVILTVSMDLPFAQKRWCGAEGIERVITLSDYRNADFGKAYGILIKEIHLLARTIFVVDKQGVIRYVQAVKEISTEPDYNAVLDAANKLR
jgi:thioredoxin-dependent peroxiredoxin